MSTRLQREDEQRALGPSGDHAGHRVVVRDGRKAGDGGGDDRGGCGDRIAPHGQGVGHPPAVRVRLDCGHRVFDVSVAIQLCELQEKEVVSHDTL